MQRAAPDAPRSTLALIGLRCSGKTTLGRELARRLDVPFVDLDQALLELAHQEAIAPGSDSPGALLVTLGESAFRDLETRALERVLARAGPCVLATGGGVVERALNRTLLSGRALCVWLRADLDLLRARLRADPTPRPSLTGADAADELAALAHRRDPFYSHLSSLVLDTDRATPAALADTLAEALDPTARPRFALQGG